jgi:hypothetical protein
LAEHLVRDIGLRHGLGRVTTLGKEIEQFSQSAGATQHAARAKTLDFGLELPCLVHPGSAVTCCNGRLP